MTNSKTHLINAQDQILGRLAVKIAVILRGKDQTVFAYNVANDAKVIVYNTDEIRFSGKKFNQKKYYSHSGYPGGIKERSLKIVFEKDSGEVLRKAVWGMLPKNRLRSRIFKNLKIYSKSLPKKYAKK